jgi:hypothetical protein
MVSQSGWQFCINKAIITMNHIPDRKEGLTGPEEAPFAGTARQSGQNYGFFASAGCWCCFIHPIQRGSNFESAP